MKRPYTEMETAAPAYELALADQSGIRNVPAQGLREGGAVHFATAE